jgi:uncharacterized hydrophobic protein (TIGR00271 family)
MTADRNRALEVSLVTPPPVNDPRRSTRSALTPLGRLRLEPVSIDQLASIEETLAVGTRVSLDFVWLAISACVIATIGLLVNSPAVIIGAMIISPLMLSIQAIALGLVRADYGRAVRSAGVLAFGAMLALVCSSAVATLDAGALLPGLDHASTEISNRTKPWLPDMIVALAGGAAGAYALLRPGVSGAIAGVAISTALMPPLCVVGIGIANRDLDVSRGALYLFLANVAGIVFASAMVFVAARIGPSIRDGSVRQIARSVGVVILVLVPICAPLAYFMQGIALDLIDEQTARAIVRRSLESIDDAEIVRLSIARRDLRRLDVSVTIRSPRPLTADDVAAFQSALTESLPGTATVHAMWVPSFRVRARAT